MIRPDDFDVEIGNSDRGTFVRVTHKPTGNQRMSDPVADGSVGKARDSLIAELRRLLFAPEDIRVDIGRTDDGEFIRVVHIPSGIERWALRRDCNQEKLLDEVLDELFACQSHGPRRD